MRDIEALCRTPEWAREVRADMAYWGITNKDIADSLGVTAALISLILTGKKEPSGERNGVVKEDIIKAERTIRDVRAKACERWRARNGGK